jgi:hypothetical protein
MLVLQTVQRSSLLNNNDPAAKIRPLLSILEDIP